MQNENRVDEMCKILDSLHQYVPSKEINVTLTLPDGNKIERSDYRLTRILLGGDQLTVARIYGAQGMRRSHDHTKEKLSGIIPVVEDWHSRQTLMQVISVVILYVY